MARRISQNVKVEVSASGAPRAFAWRGYTYGPLTLIESWRESGCWWDGEPQRHVFRVTDACGGVFELHHLAGALFPLGEGSQRPSYPPLRKGG